MNKKEIKKEYWQMVLKDAKEIMTKTAYENEKERMKLIEEASLKHYPKQLYLARLMYKSDLSLQITAMYIWKELHHE